MLNGPGDSSTLLLEEWHSFNMVLCVRAHRDGQLNWQYSGKVPWRQLHWQ